MTETTDLLIKGGLAAGLAWLGFKFGKGEPPKLGSEKSFEAWAAEVPLESVAYGAIGAVVGWLGGQALINIGKDIDNPTED